MNDLKSYPGGGLTRGGTRVPAGTRGLPHIGGHARIFFKLFRQGYPGASRLPVKSVCLRWADRVSDSLTESSSAPGGAFPLLALRVYPRQLAFAFAVLMLFATHMLNAACVLIVG